MRAVEPGEAYQTLSFVRPGGEILLKIEGWPKVEDVLHHVDAIEAIGIDADAVSPESSRKGSQDSKERKEEIMFFFALFASVAFLA